MNWIDVGCSKNIYNFGTIKYILNKFGTIKVKVLVDISIAPQAPSKTRKELAALFLFSSRFFGGATARATALILRTLGVLRNMY